MNKFTITLNEEQLYELKRKASNAASHARITKEYIENNIINEAAGDVAAEVYRLADIWSQIYTAAVIAKKESS